MASEQDFLQLVGPGGGEAQEPVPESSELTQLLNQSTKEQLTGKQKAGGILAALGDAASTFAAIKAKRPIPPSAVARLTRDRLAKQSQKTKERFGKIAQLTRTQERSEDRAADVARDTRRNQFSIEEEDRAMVRAEAKAAAMATDEQKRQKSIAIAFAAQHMDLTQFSPEEIENMSADELVILASSAISKEDPKRAKEINEQRQIAAALKIDFIRGDPEDPNRPPGWAFKLPREQALKMFDEDLEGMGVFDPFVKEFYGDQLAAEWEENQEPEPVPQPAQAASPFAFDLPLTSGAPLSVDPVAAPGQGAVGLLEMLRGFSGAPTGFTTDPNVLPKP